MKNEGGGKVPTKKNDPTTHGAKEIWDTLSAIDVSEYVDQKGNLDYLSWGGAWTLLMGIYPTAKFCFAHEDQGGVFYFHDGSAEVQCTVTINGVIRSIHLPVMDYRNNAIVEPDSRAISDSKVRSLVKALGLHGLGMYLYVGGEPPQEEEVVTKKKGDAKKKLSPPKATTSNGAGSDDPDNENKVALTLSIFAEDAPSTDSLLSLYRANKDEIDKMEKEDPEAHREMMNVFTRRKAALLGTAQETKENDSA